MEIFGTGDDTFDWYSFTVGPEGALAIVNIDCGRQYPGYPETGCSDVEDLWDPFIQLFKNGEALPILAGNDSLL